MARFHEVAHEGAGLAFAPVGKALPLVQPRTVSVDCGDQIIDALAACRRQRDHRNLPVRDTGCDEAERAFDAMSTRGRRDAETVEEDVRRAVRREANRIWGKKPWVEVIVLEV